MLIDGERSPTSAEDVLFQSEVFVAIAVLAGVRMVHVHDHASKPKLSAAYEIEDFINEVIQIARGVSAPRVF